MKIGEGSILNEYERQRLENIRRNEEILRQLNIPELSRSPSQPTRQSLRLRGFTPDGADAKREAEKVEKRREREKRVRLMGDLDLNTVRSDMTSIDDTNYFVDLLSKMKRFSDDESTISDDIDYSSIAGGADGFKTAQRAYRSLAIRTQWASVKVTPERIYSIAVHPAKEKVLAAAGDRDGWLGFWDVNETVKSEDDDYEDQPRTYMFQAHSAPISSTMYSPTDSNHLYTCSYDGSIRFFDFNQAKFMEAFIYSGTKEPECQLSSMDMDPNGQIIYFSTNGGKFGIKDIREPVEKFTEYELHEHKIGCISINKVLPHYLITASLDRSMRLWDIRKLNSESSIEIQKIRTNNAITSAYWSPNGNQVAISCFDDTVKVYDFDKETYLRQRFQTPHNNRTGRWVTMFRAIWNPNQNVHPHYIIGDMQRSAEIFSGVKGELIWTLRDDRLTAIPAVNAFHPNLNLIISGNASGRMNAWEENAGSSLSERFKSMPQPIVVINGNHL
ncbi:6918_t:CDS:2 [Dentiscutata erythropus]|uniref:DNA damage-binding protein CMR1 n=1 Tax=Dentiscutata erythropus TaxID=1348616 RepID=A0A9N9BBK5_9GLOM|nr:6918_t:CDS:2 [Dentiscutata erythropus]